MYVYFIFYINFTIKYKNKTKCLMIILRISFYFCGSFMSSPMHPCSRIEWIILATYFWFFCILFFIIIFYHFIVFFSSSTNTFVRFGNRRSFLMCSFIYEKRNIDQETDIKDRFLYLRYAGYVNLYVADVFRSLPL